MLVKPSEDPMANARLFLEARYTKDANALLRSHGGILRAWSGSAWPELLEDTLTSEIYLHFEKAKNKAKTEKGFKRVPFNPTEKKVSEIAAAIAAVSQLPDEVSMPFWIENAGAALVEVRPAELIPMANGLLHVPTRKLYPPTPAFFCPYALPYEYDPDAPPPERFFQFLNELWPDDQESQGLLQEFIGYLLVPDTSQQKMLLLVGPRRSGKGTIGRLIRELLGEHNVAGPTLASLATNFGLQPLIDKPVAIIPDARLSSRNRDIVVERLLSISGEDALTIDRKYKSAWTGPLPSRIVIITNELPQLDDTSGVLASRFVVLEMIRRWSKLGGESWGLVT